MMERPGTWGCRRTARNRWSSERCIMWPLQKHDLKHKRGHDVSWRSCWSLTGWETDPVLFVCAALGGGGDGSPPLCDWWVGDSAFCPCWPSGVAGLPSDLGPGGVWRHAEGQAALETHLAAWRGALQQVSSLTPSITHSRRRLLSPQKAFNGLSALHTRRVLNTHKTKEADRCQINMLSSGWGSAGSIFN